MTRLPFFDPDNPQPIQTMEGFDPAHLDAVHARILGMEPIRLPSVMRTDAEPDVMPPMPVSAQQLASPFEAISNAPASDVMGLSTMHGFNPQDDYERALGDRSADGILKTLGTLGFEATGIPGVIRGVQQSQRGYDEGSPLRMIGGGAQAAVSALPIGSLVSKPIAALASQLFGSIPRAAGTIVGSSAPVAIADTAEAASASNNKINAAVSSDADVVRLRNEIRRLESEQLALSSKPRPNLNRQSADQARARDAEILRRRLEGEDGKGGLRKELADAEARARESALEALPFREANPYAAGAMYAGGVGAALAIPAMKGFASKIGDAFKRGPRINRAADDAAAAISSGSSVADAATKQQILQRRLSDWDRQHGAVNATAQGVANATKGALLAAEGSALPEQIDYIMTPDGSPRRESAKAAFRDPNYWYDRAVPAAQGAVASTLGSVLGKGAGSLVTFGRGPDLTKAREAASRGQQPTTDASINQITDYKEAVKKAELRLQEIKRLKSTKARPSDREAPPASTAGEAAVDVPAPQQSASGIGQPQTRPIRPSPLSDPAERPHKYNIHRQQVARPLIISEVAAGRPVPDRSAVESALRDAGMLQGGRPLEQAFDKKIDAARSLVETLRSSGLPNDQVAGILKKLMERPGQTIYPAIGAVGLGGVAHHSALQPRDDKGRFTKDE